MREIRGNIKSRVNIKGRGNRTDIVKGRNNGNHRHKRSVGLGENTEFR